MAKKPPTRQTGFRIDETLFEAFEDFCARNMIDKRVLLESALLYAISLNHEDRVALREKLNVWLSEQAARLADIASAESVHRRSTQQGGQSRPGESRKPRQSNG